MHLKLYFGSHLVGTVEDAFWADRTGYGMFRPSDSDNTECPERIQEYIAFSKEWHQRLTTGQPHDANEFDAYRDVVESDAWRISSTDGEMSPIGCPVFVEQEISWATNSST